MRHLLFTLPLLVALTGTLLLVLSARPIAFEPQHSQR